MLKNNLSRFIGVPIMAMLLSGSLAMRPADAPKPCVVAEAWANDHVASLPSSYATIVALPMEYRRAVYRRLSVSQRAALWQEHLDEVLHESTTLSTEQRQFILFARERLPQYLDGATGRDAMRADEFDKRAKALFGALGASLVFQTLGPIGSSVTPIGVATNQVTAATPEGAAALPRAQCSCSSWNTFCVVGDACRDTGCTQTSDGCGTFWCQPCNGDCAYAA